jgi:hypothetical protein
MIVPFRFTWTPAAADATTTINPVSQSDNAVLAALLAIGASALTNAQLAATQLPTDAQKFWVTEFSVTAKYGCEVHHVRHLRRVRRPLPAVRRGRAVRPPEAPDQAGRRG